MKLLLLLALPLSNYAYKFPVHQSSPQGKFFFSQLADGLASYEETIEQLMKENLSQNKYRLDRFDLQFGVSASSDFAVISAGGTSAVEFIWQRNTESGDLGDDIDEAESREVQPEISVDFGMTEDEIATAMIKQIDVIPRLRKANKKARKSIIKLFRRDAQRISKRVKSLVLMPTVGRWYVGGFFKNYTFKSGISAGLFSIGSDLRIRFRFKITQVPLIDSSQQKLNLRQRSMLRLMKSFNYMSARSHQVHRQFQLKRVFTLQSLDSELDIGIATIGAGKGILVEYKKTKEENNSMFIDFDNHINKKKFAPLSFVNNGFIKFFDQLNINDINQELSLHQIRTKYTGSLETGFKIATLGAASTIEFHYKR